MATRSTVPSVKATLVSQLQAVASADGNALTGALVSRSHPGERLTRMNVYLGPVRGTSDIPVSRGARVVRQEAYQVELIIHRAIPGPDSQAAEEAAFGMYGELEDLLADDPTLGQPLIKAWVVDFELLVGQDDAERGWDAKIVVQVGVDARLT